MDAGSASPDYVEAWVCLGRIDKAFGLHAVMNRANGFCSYEVAIIEGVLE